MSESMVPVTVIERLASFMGQQANGELPDFAEHEARRLLLNQLKASVVATDHPAIAILEAWANGRGRDARVLWSGNRTSVEAAAMVNGALFEVLDFHDTYIPTYLHAVSGVLPAVLAVAEHRDRTVTELARALAIGIEVELAIAEILMPTGYFRGFVPLGLVGGVGAAAACASLTGLDEKRTRNALSLAMCTAGGPYESVGSMGLPFITAITARGGITAYEFAAAGMDSPVTMFEGDKGMLASYSNEPSTKIEAVLGELGSRWRILGQSYKTMPTETITHAPVEAVLAARARADGRTIDRIRFGVSPIVVSIADERRDRFGPPSSDLQARFDLRHCVAAAWHRGRFTIEEMRPAAFTDPEILDLRARIELIANPQQITFDGAWLEIVFADGSSDRIDIPAFKGDAGNPLTDDELSALFSSTADGHLEPGVDAAIVGAVLGSDPTITTRSLMDMLVVKGR